MKLINSSFISAFIFNRESSTHVSSGDVDVLISEFLAIRSVNDSTFINLAVLHLGDLFLGFFQFTSDAVDNRVKSDNVSVISGLTVGFFLSHLVETGLGLISEVGEHGEELGGIDLFSTDYTVCIGVVLGGGLGGASHLFEDRGDSVEAVCGNTAEEKWHGDLHQHQFVGNGIVKSTDIVHSHIASRDQSLDLSRHTSEKVGLTLSENLFFGELHLFVGDGSLELISHGFSESQ